MGNEVILQALGYSPVLESCDWLATGDARTTPPGAKCSPMHENICVEAMLLQWHLARCTDKLRNTSVLSDGYSNLVRAPSALFRHPHSSGEMLQLRAQGRRLCALETDEGFSYFDYSIADG